MQPTPEEDEPDDEDGDVDDVSESDNDELDTDMIDERDSGDDVNNIAVYFELLFSMYSTVIGQCMCCCLLFNIFDSCGLHVEF